MLIIISREFLVIAMRQRLAELRMQQKIKVLMISKIKTALQFVSLLLLLYKFNIFGYDIYLLGIFTLQLAAILTVISFFTMLKTHGMLLLNNIAGIAQLVERNLAKVEVASSSLVSRSVLCAVNLSF